MRIRARNPTDATRLGQGHRSGHIVTGRGLRAAPCLTLYPFGREDLLGCLAALQHVSSTGALASEEGAIMGREDKRQRERTIRQLKRRLRRKPTEEEVEKALANLRQAKRSTTARDWKY
jgi:hypothetical protein